MSDNELTSLQEDGKVAKEDISHYLTRCILIMFLVNSLTYIPGLVLMFNKHSYDYYTFFKGHWWILLIITLVFIAMNIFIFIKSEQLQLRSTNLSYIIFPIYVLFIIAIYTFLSFYSIELTLTFTGMLSAGLFLCYFFNNFSILDDKVWLKLTLIYSIVFIYMVLYTALVQNYFVEFFMLCVYALVLFGYINSQLKHILIRYSKDNKYNRYDFNLRFYMTSIILSTVDIFVCAFR
jgi:hypothetical protein